MHQKAGGEGKKTRNKLWKESTSGVFFKFEGFESLREEVDFGG